MTGGMIATLYTLAALVIAWPWLIRPYLREWRDRRELRSLLKAKGLPTTLDREICEEMRKVSADLGVLS
jgi:hypothetical protein